MHGYGYGGFELFLLFLCCIYDTLTLTYLFYSHRLAKFSALSLYYLAKQVTIRYDEKCSCQSSLCSLQCTEWRTVHNYCCEMAKRVLTRTGLPSETCSALASIGVTTCGELLLTSPLTIMSACDVSYQEALQLIYRVSEKIAPAPTTALQSLQQRKKQSVYLATGLVPLDRALRGGLLLGTITDLCGAPGVGKTQFCLSCVIQYLAEGFKRGESKNRSVIYIDAELKLDASRLIEIAAERFPDIFSPDHNISAPHNLDDLLTHIQILRPNSATEFEAVVAELQTTIVRAKASLVIVDSIASIVRKENWDEREKEAFLIAQSQTLKMTSEVCGCAILATNQV